MCSEAIIPFWKVFNNIENMVWIMGWEYSGLPLWRFQNTVVSPYGICFSLTEVYFLGFSCSIKEGTQKHTQSVKRQGRRPARNCPGHPKKHIVCYGTTTVILIIVTFSTRGPQ